MRGRRGDTRRCRLRVHGGLHEPSTGPWDSIRLGRVHGVAPEVQMNLRRSITPATSGLMSIPIRTASHSRPVSSAIGIVAHLADAQRHWLVRSFLGESASLAPRWWGESDEPLHSSLDAYDAQCERSRQITAAHDLGDIERYARDGLPLVSLRWVLGHLIEETARHLPPGHLARTHRPSPWLLAPLQWPITREARSQAGRFTVGAAQWCIQLAAHFVNVCAGL